MSSIQKRSVEISVRLTPNEHIELKERAAQEGMNLARFLRERGLGRLRSRNDRAAVSALVKVGNNLNQIARSLNIARIEGGKRLGPQVAQILPELRSTLRTIVEMAEAITAAPVSEDDDG